MTKPNTMDALIVSMSMECVDIYEQLCSIIETLNDAKGQVQTNANQAIQLLNTAIAATESVKEQVGQ